MRMAWTGWVVGAVAALGGGASRAPAQTPPAWFGQVAYGPAASSGGSYFHRVAFGSDVLIGRALTSSKYGAGLLAVTAGAVLPTGSYITCPTSQPCLGNMPTLFHGAVLGGLMLRGTRGSANVMVGPGVIGSNEFVRLGLHVRADLALPAVAHIALVLSPQLLLVPNIGKTQLSVRSLLVGVRLR